MYPHQMAIGNPEHRAILSPLLLSPVNQANPASPTAKAMAGSLASAAAAKAITIKASRGNEKASTASNRTASARVSAVRRRLDSHVAGLRMVITGNHPGSALTVAIAPIAPAANPTERVESVIIPQSNPAPSHAPNPPARAG